MAFESTRSELLKQASSLSKLFKQTRDKKYREEELRIRKIVNELESITLLGAQNFQDVTDEGSVTTNSIEASSFVKTGGTSAQFLKADGSIDSTAYLSGSVTVDYNDDIVGLRDGVNNTFSTSQLYVPGTIRVFLNGLRQSRGSDYDYQESLSADAIIFTFPILSTDVLLFEYVNYTAS